MIIVGFVQSAIFHEALKRLHILVEAHHHEAFLTTTTRATESSMLCSIVVHDEGLWRVESDWIKASICDLLSPPFLMEGGSRNL